MTTSDNFCHEHVPTRGGIEGRGYARGGQVSRGGDSSVSNAAPSMPVLLNAKGFEIVIHEEASRWSYEIRHGDRALVSSPTTYASETTALHAARVFVDGVNRRMGLDPPGRED